MGRLDDLRRDAEKALDADPTIARKTQPKLAPPTGIEAQSFTEGVIPAGNFTDDPNENVNNADVLDTLGEETDDAAYLDQNSLETLQAAQMREAAMIREGDGRPDVVNPEDSREQDSRTYVLRQGGGETFPVMYPNGEAVYVKFKDGTKTLTGHLMKHFHKEYLSNPSWRMRVSEVDTKTADKIASEYRAKRNVATPGLTSQPMKPLNQAATREGFLRTLQEQATNRGNVQDKPLLREFVTENGDSIG